MKLQSTAKTWAPLLCLWLLFVSVNAHAQISSAGVFDNVLLKYQTAAAGWATYITGRATWLFWTLAVISMVWTFGMMALRRADIGEFFAEFIKFTVSTGFFWWLLTNGPSFATSIYSSLRTIGATASGLSNNLSPSGIVDIGFQIFDRVVDQSSIWKPTDSLVGLIIAVLILGVLALVGVNMLLLLISGWILAYSGIFFLGFGGSRWTSEMAIGYYKQVLNVAVQLMVMVLLVGIGKSFLDDYYTAMSVGVTLKEMAVMLVVCVILLALVNKVPGMVASIAGGHTGNIGQFGAGSLLAAGGVAAAAAATGGAALAAGATSAAGGASALKAAFSKASENVAAGTDVMSSLGGGGASGGGAGSTAPGGVGGGGSGGASGGGGGSGGSPFASAAGLSAPPAEGSGSGGDTSPSSGGAAATAAGGGGGRTGGSSGAAGGSSSSSGARRDAILQMASAGGTSGAAAGVGAAGNTEAGGGAAGGGGGGSTGGEGAAASAEAPAGEAGEAGSTPGGGAGAEAAGGTAAGAPGAAPAPGRAARAAGAVARAAGTAGRIAVDAGANLAKGTGIVAREKAGDIADKARERISNTTGGKIAAAIRGMNAQSDSGDTSAGQGAAAEAAPKFEGNSISAGEAEDEIAAFRDRQQGNTPTT